jgi:hypothetical protein
MCPDETAAAPAAAPATLAAMAVRRAVQRSAETFLPGVQQVRSGALARQDATAATASPAPPPHGQRALAGELGMAFAGYRAEDGWGMLIGPGGSAGHRWNQPGFDGVAFSESGPLVIHIIDNKSYKGAGRVGRRGVTALTRPNLTRNLDDLIAHVGDPHFDNVPRIGEVRRALRQGRTALASGARLPSNVQLVITNYGGRASGVTRTLAAEGVVFRDLMQSASGSGGGGSAPPPPSAGPATPPRTAAAANRQRLRVLVDLDNATSRSQRFSSRLSGYVGAAGQLLGVLELVGAVSDIADMATQGTVLPDAERQARLVRSQARAAASHAAETYDAISLLDATAAVHAAIQGPSAEHLAELAHRLDLLADPVLADADGYRVLAGKLRSQQQAIRRVSDLYLELAAIPQIGSTAGNASALAMHESLQRLSGLLADAAAQYGQGDTLLRFLGDHLRALAASASREGWRRFAEQLRAAGLLR